LLCSNDDIAALKGTVKKGIKTGVGERRKENIW
jgi:hypothetical protein